MALRHQNLISKIILNMVDNYLYAKILKFPCSHENRSIRLVIIRNYYLVCFSVSEAIALNNRVQEPAISRIGIMQGIPPQPLAIDLTAASKPGAGTRPSASTTRMK